MDARETAERHGAYVTSGNMQAVMADFKPEALQEFMALGKMPPRRSNTYEVLSERQEGDTYIYDIKYTNPDQETLTVRSTWAKMGDDWKIVKAEPMA